MKGSAKILSNHSHFQYTVMSERNPLLAFSTLGCPDWNFKQIVEFASVNGFQGIEIRGLQREMDLPLAKEFNSPKAIAETLYLMQQKGLKFAALGSSANMHIEESLTRRAQMDEAKRFIDLAHKIGCPFVRVFPNKIPKGRARKNTLELIASGILELRDYAKGSQTTVLIETHGDLMETEDIKWLMEIVFDEKTGLLWDMANVWSATQVPPEEYLPEISKYIRHTHIKDLKIVDGQIRYLRLGQGEVPLTSGINALAESGYMGYYCFEWEKLWHEEIEDSATAISDFVGYMAEKF
jgi:sugar phosphate isomerase/epimerase